jgi:carbonic anhydrase
MQRLLTGIHQFQDTIFKDRREFFERLAESQKPEALFITCSDSRINPNLLTQTSPGELFIMRNAGNIIPAYGAVRGGEEATIEYAVSALGVTDIVVCGHSQCGAMKGLLDPALVKKLPAMTRWLEQAEATKAIMSENYTHLEGEQLLTATVEENVLVQLENLRTHPAVASGLAGGKLHLHGWVYNIATGEVYGYDPAAGQYTSISHSGKPSTSMLVRPNGKVFVAP